MAWVQTSMAAGLQSLDSRIGSCQGDGQFIIGQHCLETLKDIQRLLVEGQNATALYQFMTANDTVGKTLVPLLCSLRDDGRPLPEETWEIWALALWLLAYVTQPSECLAGVQQSGHHDNSQSVDEEFSCRQQQWKQCLMRDHEVMTSLMRHARGALSKVKERSMTATDTSIVNSLLYLWRNLLHTTEDCHQTTQAYVPEQNAHFIRWLFENGIQDVLMGALLSEQMESWCLPLLQLIVLLFQDQSALEDGADCSCCCDRDGDACASGQYQAPGSQRGSDCESLSESPCESLTYCESLCCEPDTETEASDLSGASRVITDHGQPRNKNPREEFTEEFLTQGLSPLILTLQKLMMSRDDAVPGMYITWSVAYFLKLARRHCSVHLGNLLGCLNVDTVRYLVYLCVSHIEHVMCSKDSLQSARSAKLVHLSVVGLKESLKMIAHLEKHETTNMANLQKLKGDILEMSDMRNILLLLLESYSTEHFSTRYLTDLVQCNHSLLVIAESVKDARNFDMLEHVKNFATREVMQRYGVVLANFENNTWQQNECVLTMMYHVVGDCGQPETLLQMPIIQTFVSIWESEMAENLSEEFQDLTVFVLQQCVQLAENNPSARCLGILHGTELEDLGGKEESTQMIGMPSSASEEKQMETSACIWTEEEELELAMLYGEVEDTDSSDLLGCLSGALEERGVAKTEQEVEVNMITQGLIGLDIVNATGRGVRKQVYQDAPASQNSNMSVPEICKHLAGKLDRLDAVKWLKSVLMEVCYMKMGGRSLDASRLEEPIPLYFTALQKSVPVVAYTQQQREALRDPHFSLLLDKLGIHSPADDSGMMFPRIPYSWKPDQLAEKAGQLGEVDYEDPKSARMEELVASTVAASRDGQVRREKHTELKSEWVGCLPEGLWVTMVRHNMEAMTIHQPAIVIPT